MAQWLKKETNKHACSAGDMGSVPGFGRSPGKGNGNPLQYSFLENSIAEEPGGLQSTGSDELDMIDTDIRF